MSKSNTPADPRDWDDEQIDALLQRLEEHVDTDTELGQAVKSRRRDVLKAIGALGAGTLAGAAGMEAASDSARAADTSAGQLGTAGSSVDITLDEIKDPGGDPVADLDDSGLFSFQRGLDLPEVQTGKFNDILYATEYSGADGGEMIQAAIDDATSKSQFTWVVVPAIGPDANDNWVTSSTINIKDGVGLRIEGYIKLADGTNANVFENADTTDGNSNFKVVGEGGVIDGNRANQSGSGTRTNNEGIHLVECDNWEIRGLEIKNIYQDGIFTEGLAADRNHKNYRIVDNFIHDCGDAANGVKGDAMHTEGRRGTVSGNICRDCYDTGVAVDQATNIIVENNLIEGGDFIQGMTCAVGAFECTYDGNTVRDAKTGFRADDFAGSGPDGVQVTDNTFVSCIDYGVFVGVATDVDVHDNVIEGGSNQGVIVGPDASEVSLVGNTIRDAAEGIKWNDSNNGLVANNKLYDNTTTYDVTRDANYGTVFRANKPMYFEADETFSVAANGTATLEIGDYRGKAVDVTATPANDPDSTHAYEVTKVYWDDSQSELRAEVNEVQGNSGGDVRITARIVD